MSYSKKILGIALLVSFTAFSAFANPAASTVGAMTATPPGVKNMPAGVVNRTTMPQGWTQGYKAGWRCKGNVCQHGHKVKRHCLVSHGVWTCP